MNNPNNGPTAGKIPGAESFNTAGYAEAVRDLLGIQVRTAQAMVDKSLTLGQTVTDYVQTQMNEGMKLSQEVLRHGWSVAENIKKSSTDLADRVFRA